MIDWVFVNPNNRLPTPLAAVEPPLWLGLSASYREQQGASVSILDAEAEDLSIDETADRIRRMSPTNVLLVVQGNNPSVSSTPKMPIAEALADRISDLNVSFTGLHPIALNYPNTIKTPFRGFPDMPFDKLPMELYRAHNWHCLDGSPRSPYASVYTGLGCSFSCYFCDIHTLYGGRRKVLFRPIPAIIKEIDTLVARYHVRNIKFWDELFALKEDRVLAICEMLKDYDLNIWAYARLDTVTEKMLKAMKRGGINWLAYGFESVVNSKMKEYVRAIQMTRDAGINIMANFMFGLPEDTEDSMKATLDMAIRENFEYVIFYVALPYPGSEWYTKLKDKPTDWSSFSQFSPNICADPKVVKFRDEAFKSYFTRPEYLSMIKTKFGEKAVEHIKEMIKWRIR